MLQSSEFIRPKEKAVQTFSISFRYLLMFLTMRSFRVSCECVGKCETNSSELMQESLETIQ